MINIKKQKKNKNGCYSSSDARADLLIFTIQQHPQCVCLN